MSASLHSVRLTCGMSLRYADAVCSPRPGELVPCPRHGYCSVSEQADAASVPPRRVRRPARTRAELLEFVASRQAVSVTTLLRHRFRLRLVHSAAADGLVEFGGDESVRIKQGASEIRWN